MKVSELVEQLSKLEPDSEVCALIYTKELFDFPDEDVLKLTDKGWARVVEGFEEETFDDIWISIYDACIELSEITK